MCFEVLTLEKKYEWDKIVKSFDNYEVSFLSDYVNAFKNRGDGNPFLFYYHNGNQRAITVMFKRDIGLDSNLIGKIETNKYFDLCSPYGYGGWIFDSLNLNWNYKEYFDWCKANNIVCEFIRFSLYTKSETLYYGDVVNRQSNVICDLSHDYDCVYDGYDRGTKKDIKAARKYDLEILIDERGDYLDDFLNIYYSTMDRNNAKDSYYFDKEYFERILAMKENFVFFHVKKDNVIIATELVLKSNDKLYSFLGGTLKEFYQYHPNHFLKDEVIKYGIKNNYRMFILGGGYDGDDGIFRFKKSFSKDDSIVFKTGQYVFDRDIYDQLSCLSNKNSSGFFPVYRS